MIEFSQVYGNRKRRKYGLFSNLMYNIRAVWQFDRKLFWCQFLPIVPTVLAAYLGTLLPAEVVRVLQEGWSAERIIGYICLLTAVLLVCNMISKGMNGYTGTVSHRLSLFYADKCFRKVMDLDYDLLEQSEKQDVIGNAWKGVRDSYNFDLACMAFPICLSSWGQRSVLWNFDWQKKYPSGGAYDFVGGIKYVSAELCQKKAQGVL